MLQNPGWPVGQADPEGTPSDCSTEDWQWLLGVPPKNFLAGLEGTEVQKYANMMHNLGLQHGRAIEPHISLLHDFAILIKSHFVGQMSKWIIDYTTNEGNCAYCSHLSWLLLAGWPAVTRRVSRSAVLLNLSNKTEDCHDGNEESQEAASNSTNQSCHADISKKASVLAISQGINSRGFWSKINQLALSGMQLDFKTGVNFVIIGGTKCDSNACIHESKICYSNTALAGKLLSQTGIFPSQWSEA